jgi:transposase InsO family protein
MRINPKDIIKTVRQHKGNIDCTAKDLLIHRTTVWRWIKRSKALSYGRLGDLTIKSLKRLSTRPHRISYGINAKDRQRIKKLRQEKKYTAEKIKRRLNLSVVPLTIHRYLKKEGLINKYGNHRRPYYQKTTHMHLRNTTEIGYLQMDVKYITPELSGLPYTCFEYAVIDIFSRYKEAIILNHLDQDGAILALIEIRKRLPFEPVFIQTDNGLEFQGRFHVYCNNSGLKHHLIHKSTPNENAVIERTFRTDEEEFFFMMKKAPKDYDELRYMLKEWLYEYNYERPHLGIDLKTPYEIVAKVMLD